MGSCWSSGHASRQPIEPTMVCHPCMIKQLNSRPGLSPYCILAGCGAQGRVARDIGHGRNSMARPCFIAFHCTNLATSCSSAYNALPEPRQGGQGGPCTISFCNDDNIATARHDTLNQLEIALLPLKRRCPFRGSLLRVRASNEPPKPTHLHVRSPRIRAHIHLQSLAFSRTTISTSLATSHTWKNHADWPKSSLHDRLFGLHAARRHSRPAQAALDRVACSVGQWSGHGSRHRIVALQSSLQLMHRHSTGDGARCPVTA